MNRHSRSFRILALLLIVLGGGAAIANVMFLPGERLGLALAIDAVFVALGAWLLNIRRNAPLGARDASEEAPPPTATGEARASEAASATAAPAAAGTGATFGLVLVLCDESAKSPLYDQAHGALLRHIASSPGRPLAPDVRVIDIWAPSLPADERAALEPVVWSLQQRFARRSGAWHADFHNPLGQDFVVLYLE